VRVQQLTAAPDFRSFEISDPTYERDDLRHVTVRSAALGGRGDVTFFVPGALRADAPVPLAVLLHGAYGSHWAWALQGGAHHTARRMMAAGTLPPMVLAMPSDGLAADSTAYIAHGDVDYASWIVRDIKAIAMRVHPAITPASPLCITGLSMGGFGALHLGLRYPEHFAAVSAHSAVTDVARRFGQGLSPSRAEIHRLRADASLSVLHWAKRHRDELPPFRFDCGSDDALCRENRDLASALTAEGIAHTYDEFAGGHDWAYWQTHLEDSLRFFAQVLRGVGR